MELTRIYKVLELQNGASIDAIIESIQAAQAEGEDNAKIIAALEEQLAAMKTEKDEMAEANEEMKAQLAQVEAEKLEGEAETVVLEAIKKGQYEAAEKDLKIEQYKVNKDWVLKELEIRQPKNDAPVSLGARSDSNAVELSNEDRAIMLSLSMDPDNADERKAFLADINEGV
jgi:multidrug efflux pump subunit AcrA (membrane-fusion protein)